MTDDQKKKYSLMPRNPEYKKFDQIGETFEFVYIKTLYIDSRFGEQNVWYVKDDKGNFVYITTTIILWSFDKFLVSGKQYMLEYIAEEKTKQGNTMKMFNIFIKTVH